jgi:hypothetical protein
VSAIPFAPDFAFQVVDFVLPRPDDGLEVAFVLSTILSRLFRLGKRDVQSIDLSVPFMKDRRALSNNLLLVRNNIVFLLAKGIQLFQVVVPVADRLTNVCISVHFTPFEGTLALVQLLIQPLLALHLSLLQPFEAIVLVNVLSHEVVTRFLTVLQVLPQTSDCVVSCILELAVAPSHCFKPFLCGLCLIPPAYQLGLSFSKAIFQIRPGNLRRFLGGSPARFEVCNDGVLAFQPGFEIHSLL